MKPPVFCGLLLATMIVSACSDDLGNSRAYGDGRLHLKISFNDPKGQWTEGTTSGTRAMRPTPMTANGMEGITLYLHCVEQNRFDAPTDSAVDTRGQRLTGEVFESEAFKSFGLYVKVGSNEYLDTLGAAGQKQLKTGYSSDGTGYYQSDSEFDFLNDDIKWGTGQNGTFYAYAPFPGTADGEAKSITVGYVSSVPTLTFTMLDDETDNVDVLTAKKSLTYEQKKADGVELQLRHVLTAVKFKQPSGGLYYPVMEGSVEKERLYAKITDIKLKNIYMSGSAPLGEEYTDAGEPMVRTSHWTYSEDASNQGTTSYTLATPTAQSDTYINTDEHCFMVLPQQLPSNAIVVIKCDLYTDDAMATTPKYEEISFEASLDGQTWKPGYSYTYTISNKDLVHVLEMRADDGSTLTYDITGGSKIIQVRSFLASYREDGDYSAVTVGIPEPWHPQFENDGSSVWNNGLPLGYTLQEEDDTPITNLNQIPGSVTFKTYKLEATIRSELSPSITSLREVENSRTDYDLSTEGGTKPMNSANCYVIQGYGTYKLPIAYGSAIKNGLTNYAAFTEADSYEIFTNYVGNHITQPWISDDTGQTPQNPFIVWQDEKNLITPSSVHIAQEGGRYYLYFEILRSYIKSGNAIIAVRDGSDRIMWSWHIWVTHQNLKNTIEASDGEHSISFMSRSLGWRLPETTEYAASTTFKMRAVQGEADLTTDEENLVQEGGTAYISGSNLYYQFGRKDPMPSQTVRRNSDNTTTDVDMVNEMQTYGYTLWQAKEEYGTMTTAIQHPYYFYAEDTNDWMNISNDNNTTNRAGRWDPLKAAYDATTGNSINRSAYALAKTVYDPCPAGFTVPPAGSFNLLSSWTKKHLAAGDTHANIQGQELSKDGKKINFYYTGNRKKVDGKVEYFKTEGRFWTAGVGGTGFGCLLRIYGTTTFTPTYTRYRTRGMSVWPVRDVVDAEFTIPPYTGNLYAKDKTSAQYIFDNIINQPGSRLVVNYNLTSTASTANKNNFKIQLNIGSTTFYTVTQTDCAITKNYQKNLTAIFKITDAMKTAMGENINSSSFEALIKAGTITNGQINYIAVMPDPNLVEVQSGTVNQNQSLVRKRTY